MLGSNFQTTVNSKNEKKPKKQLPYLPTLELKNKLETNLFFLVPMHQANALMQLIHIHVA